MKPNTKHHSKNILLTGGAGFIGANLVHFLLNNYDDCRVINLDALTYAGCPASLEGLTEQFPKRYTFIHGNICDSTLLNELFSKHEIDTVIHLAAESHVDRSIDGPLEFIRTNVMGSCTLLEAARLAWGERQDVRFHHVSTDEVYGSLGETGFFTETTSYDPSSPYSASKAGSDHLVRAWNRTFKIPVTISNCSNNYGPYQFPEKLIPLMICNALQNKPLPVYGNGNNVRDWLFVEDHCRAIDHIVRYAENGSTYNVGGNNEFANLDIVKLICKILEEQIPSNLDDGYASLIKFVKDRPGHDLRYAIDASLLEKDLGWSPNETFDSGIAKTVAWYLESDEWLQKVGYQGERLGLK